jgi:hypothetical protein
VWVVVPAVVVWFVPSPKFQTTLFIVADEMLGNAVNVIGEPALAMLVDAATDTDRDTGLVLR